MHAAKRVHSVRVASFPLSLKIRSAEIVMADIVVPSDRAETDAAGTNTMDDNNAENQHVHAENVAVEDQAGKRSNVTEEGLSLIRARHNKKQRMIENMEELGVILSVCAWCIYNIDNSAQTFSVTFEFWISRQLSEREIQQYNDDPDGFEPKQLNFWPERCVEVKEKELHRFNNGKEFYVEYLPKFDIVGVHHVWICNMVFSEVMELKNFPFDVQHCEMGFFLDGRDIAKEPHTDSKMYYRFKDVGQSNFRVYNTTLEGCDFDNQHQETSMEILEERQFHGTVIDFRAGFGVRRQWGYYLRNVVLVLAIISFLSNMCFLFGDIEDSIDNRFEFISTTLLTVVAFIFITSEYTPKLNSMTFLDKYIIATLGYVVLMAIETALMIIIDSVEWNDYAVAACNLAIWLVGHIVFAFAARMAYKKELGKSSKCKGRKPEFYKDR